MIDFFFHLHLRSIVRGSLASLALQLHLANAPGESDTDEARVEAPAAGGLVVGGRGVAAIFGHAKDVVDCEVNTQLTLEEVGASTKVNALVCISKTIKAQTRRGVVGIGEEFEPASHFGPQVEAGTPAPLVIFGTFVVVSVVEHRSIKPYIEETAGTVGNVCLKAFGMRGTNVDAFRVVDIVCIIKIRAVSEGGGTDFVGVGAEIGIEKNDRKNNPYLLLIETILYLAKLNIF